MGRHKKDDKLSNKETLKRWRKEHPEAYKYQKEKQYAKELEKKKGLSEEDLEIKRLADKERKARSRAKIAIESSRQKIEGIKLKDNIRKMVTKEATVQDTATINTSTVWVKKHREAVKIKMSFKRKLSTSTPLNRSAKNVRKRVISNITNLESPTKKACVIQSAISAQSPRSQEAIRGSFLQPCSSIVPAVEAAANEIKHKRTRQYNSSRKVLASVYGKCRSKKSPSSLLDEQKG